jgi:glucose-1-phosphate cytidylyltransferase
MKILVLAGGLGTRLAEETEIKPKPMVEIGGRPIMWHILKHYSHFGFREFVLALGYKGEVIKRYFLDYMALRGNMTIEMVSGNVQRHAAGLEDWRVHLVDTGMDSNTGGRVGRCRDLLRDGTFMLTYGDGVSNVDLQALLRFHRAQGRIATVTAVRPPSRFGGLVFDGDIVKEFIEKPQIGEGWVNGGFMVLEPAVLDYIAGDATNLEVDVLERLASERQLAAYRHEDFWQCMDTLRDKRKLKSLWQSGQAPWKVWPDPPSAECAPELHSARAGASGEHK